MDNVKLAQLKMDLSALKESKSILDRSYVKWTRDNGRGGHCALGALELGGGSYPVVQRLVASVDAACVSLYPELKGASAPRLGNAVYPNDYFESSPTAFVNNQLGKEAILKAFDAAILELEIEIAAMEPPEQEPVVTTGEAGAEVCEEALA